MLCEQEIVAQQDDAQAKQNEAGTGLMAHIPCTILAPVNIMVRNIIVTGARIVYEP